MRSDAPEPSPTSNHFRTTRVRQHGSKAFVTTAALVVLSLTVSGGSVILGRPAGAALSDGPTAAATTPNLYVGHLARLTAEIPQEWVVDPSGIFDYAGPDGVVASEPVAAPSLEDACATVAASLDGETPPSVTATTWSEQAACRVVGQYRGVDVATQVIPHGHPFSLWGTDYAFAALMADPGHLDDIVATVDFSSEKVTPGVYAASLLDLVETRSFWRDQVDWPTVRRQVLGFVDGLETVEMARQGILNIIIQNIRMMGDNQSSIALPDWQFERRGFGALLASGHVIVVYPDSPAERAGILVGDDIEAIDGRPIRFFSRHVDAFATLSFDPTGEVDDASMTVTLHRQGVPLPIEVTIEAGPYPLDALPTGGRLPGDIGLLTLSAATNGDQESAYVATANDIVSQIDAEPTCGWIVDLRFASARSYPAIIASIGPILGNGVFAGWRDRAGGQTWATYENGVIAEDGFALPRQASGQPPSLQQPDAPVAVLTGPGDRGAGELAALALMGRPETRLFGEPTGGSTTIARRYALFDGSVLDLAEAAMTDRAGSEYPDGIQPDEPIATDWTTYGTDADHGPRRRPRIGCSSIPPARRRIDDRFASRAQQGISAVSRFEMSVPNGREDALGKGFLASATPASSSLPCRDCLGSAGRILARGPRCD